MRAKNLLIGCGIRLQEPMVPYGNLLPDNLSDGIESPKTCSDFSWRNLTVGQGGTLIQVGELSDTQRLGGETLESLPSSLEGSCKQPEKALGVTFLLAELEFMYEIEASATCSREKSREDLRRETKEGR